MDNEKELLALRKQLTEIQDAVKWLYGYWDGNTLVPKNASYQDDIQEAFNDLLSATFKPDGRNR